MKKVKRLCAVLLAVALILPGVPVTTAKGAEGESYLQEDEINDLYAEYSADPNYKRVSVHDPSIVKGYYEDETYTDTSVVYGEQNEEGTRNSIYFIFGTHRVFAYSTDLMNWKTFRNNISDDATARELFADGASWASTGDTAYSLVSRNSSNLWAPDVIWNPYYENEDGTMGAWMMYMSVNGCSWNSTIALLTSDSLNGNWTYQGTVIYSGFDDANYDYTRTDYKEVTGDTSLPSRYLTGAYQWLDGNTKCDASKWYGDYGAHAIDPCIVFDDEDLWMTYGSWSGGIYMIKMDPATGLRDLETTYDLVANESDPYMGLKIAGGSFASGEASYIQKMDGTFYLFVTNGGLTADGGYNMRVFSSEDITGPYKDLSGDDARFAKSNVANKYEEGTYNLIRTNEDNINGTIGNRLMSYYKWDFMSDGYTAQGHNSVLEDDDGKKFVIYHTRFVNSGSYEDRVHQLFVAENGGLVTAPFEYCGETLSETPYNSDEIVGEYQILTMGDVNYSVKQCVTEKTLTLHKDGTVSGAYTGTWQQGEDGPKLTLECGEDTYEGVFIEQKVEESSWPAMCLTVVGDNDISIWGYRIADDQAAVVKNAVRFQGGVSARTYGDLDLVQTLPDEVTVTWKSSHPDVIAADGTVTLPSEDTQVTMTAVISRGEAAAKKEYTTTVYAEGAGAIDTDEGLEASYSFDNGDLTNAKNPSESAVLQSRGNASKPILQENLDRGSTVLHTYKGSAASGNGPNKTEASNSYAKINNPLKGKEASGATVSMWVKCDDTNVWGEIWSFFDDDTTRLFLTQNAYIGYNDGTVYFDCNNGATVTNAIGSGTWKLVTVSADQYGFGIYINGVLKYNAQENAAYAGENYDEAMGKRVLNLFNSASNFYIGYGAFWGSGELSVDNLKIYSTALDSMEVAKLYEEEKTKMDEESAAARQEQEDQETGDNGTGDTGTGGPGTGDDGTGDNGTGDNGTGGNGTGDTGTEGTGTGDNGTGDTVTGDTGTGGTGTADQNAEDKGTSEPAAVDSVTTGKTYTVGKLKYKVTSMSGGKNYVTVTGVKTKSVTSVTVKATVSINGTKFTVRQIGASAFSKCKKLKTLTIGTNVVEIGKKAFYNCKKLQKITIKSKKLTSVGSNALKGVYKKAKIKVPSAKLKSYKKLFAKKGQKKTVTITK